MGHLQTTLNWNQKMHFTGEANGHSISLDARSPLGQGSAMTPKELLLLAMAGCTAMDVVALLKKYRQEFSTFQVGAEAEKTETHPQVFTEARLTFRLTGPVDPEKFKEAARLSLTKYCGVNAMMSKATPILYTLELNGERLFDGRAEFQ